MAKRRMFNLDIIDSDVFLDMPQTSQLLYYHLGMRADDDGFVSPKKVMRMIGSSFDDLQVLIAKRYILAFDTGVVAIKHWPINNYIQKDRYIQTTYQKEKATLTFNEFGAYTELERMVTLVEEITTPTVEQVTTPERSKTPSSIQDVSKPDTQVRLGKVSIDKNNNIDTNVSIADADKKGKTEKTKAIDGMFLYWSSEVGYTITSKKKQNREYAGKLLNEYGKQDIALMIKAAALASEDQYAPGVSDFIDLYRKWDKLKLWGKKKGMRQHAVAQF